MSVQLFNATLGGALQPSSWLLITGEEVPLVWELTTNGGPTVIQFFLEFTDDPTKGAATIAAREVDEQDTGNGVVTMAKVTRTFNENGLTTGLADGSHKLATQFVRQGSYVRVQVQVTAGAASLTLTASSGSLAVAT